MLLPRRHFVTALLLGLASLGLTAMAVSFSAKPLQIHVQACFLPPVIAALAYGWRGALVAGLPLGIIFPFILWPSNGWGNIPTSIYFLFVYLWQGLNADWERRRPRWWNSQLAAAQLSILLLYPLCLVVYPLVFAANPAPWAPDAVQTIPIEVFKAIAIKETVLTLICVAAAEAILICPWPRRLLGLTPRPGSQRNGTVLLVAACTGGLLWGGLVALQRALLPQVSTGWEWQATEALALLVLIAGSLIAGTQVARYIERRRAAEESARDSNERLDLALAAAGMGTWEVASVSGALHLDPQACRILGVAGQVPGSIAELIVGFAESERPQLAAAWEAARQGNGPVAIEGWWTMHPGRKRIRLRGEPSAGAGLGRRFIGLAWDVTAEHDMRERLAQSEKMECLGRLAGGVAHDFNNHLTVIMGNIGLIRSLPDLNPAIERWTGQMAQAGEGAAVLVHDLLTFARRREARLEVLDLGQLVQRSTGLITSLVGKGVDLAIQPASAPMLVRGHAEQLQNALLNLCANARDAMGKSGRLRISVQRVSIPGTVCRISGAEILGEQIVLSVADDGSGIPEELHGRILEPFFTTKPEGKGTGLGLATVVGCVRQHGGHLSLESQPGSGSTFRIHLPVAG